jgi:hypothetical protein
VLILARPFSPLSLLPLLSDQQSFLLVRIPENFK